MASNRKPVEFDLARLGPRSTAPGNNDPDLRMIRVNDIGVDYSYQRPTSPGHVARIAKKFDPEIFGTITVSQRPDRRYYVIDGQHRLQAMIAMGRATDQVPCVVVQGLSVEQEAHIFGQLASTRKPLTPQERFRAALLAGDRVAVRIHADVTDMGLQLCFDRQGIDHGNIPGVAALEWVDDQYRAGVLREVLRLFVDTWGTDRGPRQEMIRFLADFLHLYEGRFDRNRFISRLADIPADQISSKARALKSAIGLDLNSAMHHQIAEHYNHGIKRADRRLVPVAEMRAIKKAERYGK